MTQNARIRQAVFLIGGLGTRLGDIVAETPKPLLPVGPQTFLDYLIHQCQAYGFSRFVFLAGYKSDVAREHFKNYDPEFFTVLAEDEPLGTAGALKNASDVLEDEFLLLNGDSMFQFDYRDFVLKPLVKNAARLALRRMPDASRYGKVVLEGEQVIDFQEKQKDIEQGLINGGVYHMHRRILDYIPAGFSNLEQDIFPQLVANEKLLGREYSGFFLDIGLPETYTQAKNMIPTLF